MPKEIKPNPKPMPKITPVSKIFVRTTRAWAIEQKKPEKFMDKFINDSYKNLINKNKN